MNYEDFAKRIELIRKRLYKTAFLYLGNETLALDAVDEAVYKALCSYKKLREIEYFDTWITRILINECYNEQRRQKRFGNFEELQETAVEEFDSLPLKEANALELVPETLEVFTFLKWTPSILLNT